MNHSRRDRFTKKMGEYLEEIDNELQMLVDNHNDHDAGRKGWGSINLISGANKRMGTAVLSSGTVTVNNSTVTANTKIILSRQASGGTLGHLSVGTITVGVSFVIDSSSNADTSTILWILIEPK